MGLIAVCVMTVPAMKLNVFLMRCRNDCADRNHIRKTLLSNFINANKGRTGMKLCKKYRWKVSAHQMLRAQGHSHLGHIAKGIWQGCSGIEATP